MFYINEGVRVIKKQHDMQSHHSDLNEAYLAVEQDIERAKYKA